MAHHLTVLLRPFAGRRVAVVNLDPANDVLPFTPDVDVSDLVSLERVQQEQRLGPNGGLVYCMDVLHKNMDWLEQRLRPLARGLFTFDRYLTPSVLTLLQRGVIFCLTVLDRSSSLRCMTV